MINFTSGLIKHTNFDSYINPDKIVSFSEYEDTTYIELNNGNV